VTLVGIVGGGQLGMMLAEAGATIGIDCLTLDPTPDSPASRVAPAIVGAYDDEAALAELAAASDVVTYEFENVPVGSARFLAECVPVAPPPASLEFAQDRLREKTLFEDVGLAVSPYAPVSTKEELEEALEIVGVPSVLKSRRLGYDGKGQARIGSVEIAADAWRSIGEVTSILESFVSFDRELSILGARGSHGSVAFYPLVENVHRDGVLAIELFQVGDRLLGNEFAPRVHNSGHWTIEGAPTSQFENHLRAVCGLELGPTTPSTYSGMVNLIGHEPGDDAFPDEPAVHVHRYGKQARPGRKLGHVTVVEERRDTLESVLQVITRTADNLA
jgi:5-(carboxyamino)imidazole ribonucleotide synthase